MISTNRILMMSVLVVFVSVTFGFLNEVYAYDQPIILPFKVDNSAYTAWGQSHVIIPELSLSEKAMYKTAFICTYNYTDGIQHPCPINDINDKIISESYFTLDNSNKSIMPITTCMSPPQNDCPKDLPQSAIILSNETSNLTEQTNAIVCHGDIEHCIKQYESSPSTDWNKGIVTTPPQYSLSDIYAQNEIMIEQNKQLIKLDAFNFCKINFDVLDSPYNGSFSDCVEKVLGDTK